jgi:glutamate-1-semialdehyde 2,1-aminomutase
MNVSRSKKAFTQARRVLPGGVDSPVRSFKDVGGTPRFIARGKGAYIYDVDGNRYLDFCQSWGALILGHAAPGVIRAAAAAMNAGTSFGAPTESETALAELISEAMPSIQQLRFVNSGTEAVMSAIRLARAYTRRNKIIKFDGGYHGHADHLLVAAGSGLANWATPSSAGVPESFAQETISVPYNDIAAVEKAFAKYPQEIAAIIVEPIAANMGVVLPQPGFLLALRALTLCHQSLLIFDEVITGFRLGYGGAQNYFKIRPDLTCLGKIIGGGFPAGAYGGSKKIMSLLAPLGPVYQAGTLSGNPVAMAAGAATLRALKMAGVYKKLNAKSDWFVAALQDKLTPLGIQVNAIGSMFTLFFSPSPVENYAQAKRCPARKFAQFYHKALEQGVYLSPSPFEANFASLEHSEKELAKAVSILESAAAEAGSAGLIS